MSTVAFYISFPSPIIDYIDSKVNFFFPFLQIQYANILQNMEYVCPWEHDLHVLI